MAASRDAGRIYVVTDIEVDGFVPGAHSMLALASVAVTASGEQVGEFEAVLAGLPGAQPDPQVWEWFGTQPPEVLAEPGVVAVEDPLHLVAPAGVDEALLEERPADGGGGVGPGLQRPPPVGRGRDVEDALGSRVGHRVRVTT